MNGENPLDNVFQFTDSETARSMGIDPDHIKMHMVETVLCAARGNPLVLNTGFYFQFRDVNNGTWTLSMIPEDGGVITDALLARAMEEDG